MKNLALASLVGLAAYAVPAVAGPVHYQLTRPHSMYGIMPATQTASASVQLGTAPLDFVITDLMLGTLHGSAKADLVVNGAVVLTMPTAPGTAAAATELHLHQGIYVTSGSQVEMRLTAFGNSLLTPTPVTITGYVQ